MEEEKVVDPFKDQGPEGGRVQLLLEEKKNLQRKLSNAEEQSGQLKADLQITSLHQSLLAQKLSLFRTMDKLQVEERGEVKKDKQLK